MAACMQAALRRIVVTVAALSAAAALPARQRAIVVRRHGGADVLEHTADWPVPELQPYEVLVRNEVAGVNFIDIYFRRGSYPSSPPYVAGLEGAGTVVAVGRSVKGLEPGARVAYSRTRSGSYAEYSAVDEAVAVLLPQGVSAAVGATAMIQGLTAHYLCTSSFPAGKGTKALVLAAAGGTGLAVVQVLKALGATVIGAVSTDAKAEVARAAGADHIVRYRKVGGGVLASWVNGPSGGFADWVPAVREAAGGAVDVVYDGVGKGTLLQSLHVVRPRGTVVSFGAASGMPDPVPVQALAGSKFLTRPTLLDHIATREELTNRSDDVFGWIASGALNLSRATELPLERAAEAHRRLEEGQTVGKVILTVAQMPNAEL